MTNALQITLFGGVRIVRTGDRHEVKVTHSVQALLAYLVLHYARWRRAGLAPLPGTAPGIVDELAHTFMMLGFTFLSMGLVFGCLWAQVAWGTVHLALLPTNEDRAKAVVDWVGAALTTVPGRTDWAPPAERASAP